MKNELIIDGVTKRFGKTVVLDGIKAKVMPGEITAFIGPNGAGKTTLFHIVSGVIPCDSGGVLYNGVDIAGRPPWKIARMGIGRLYQDVRVFRTLSVLENVLLAIMDYRESRPFRVLLNFIRRKKVEEDHLNEAMEWLSFVGLADKAALHGSELSRGEQKLLALARLLAKKYTFLLLDEPTSALAPAMLEKMIRMLDRLNREMGITIALIEHNMRVVAEISDWVYFIHEGRIAWVGRSDHVLEDPNVRERYIGL